MRLSAKSAAARRQRGKENAGAFCSAFDTSTVLRVFFTGTRHLVLSLVLTMVAAAADKVPLDPRSSLPASGEQLEVERIEIQKGGAIPSTLHRRPGRFLLLIINRNQSNPDAAFVIDPASVGDMALGPNPLFHAGGLGINDYKHRSASLVVAPLGEFDLKYADTGKIVCHLTIDPQ